MNSTHAMFVEQFDARVDDQVEDEICMSQRAPVCLFLSSYLYGYVEASKHIGLCKTMMMVIDEVDAEEVSARALCACRRDEQRQNKEKVMYDR